MATSTGSTRYLRPAWWPVSVVGEHRDAGEGVGGGVGTGASLLCCDALLASAQCRDCTRGGGMGPASDRVSAALSAVLDDDDRLLLGRVVERRGATRVEAADSHHPFLSF